MVFTDATRKFFQDDSAGKLSKEISGEAKSDAEKDAESKKRESGAGKKRREN